MQNLTPQAIVQELDRYIIGQNAAKRAIAVAMRNRWRRRALDARIASEIYPKNIIMIGPTGVGKTEIARRMATMVNAPFLKVEASKFTEVGYQGRDVESMVRDLLEQGIAMVRAEQAKVVAEKAVHHASERLIDLILPPLSMNPTDYADQEKLDDRKRQTRLRMKEQLDSGKLDEREVEISLTQKPQTGALFGAMGLDQMDPDMAGMFEKMMPEQTKRRRVTIAQARRIFLEQETDKLLDRDKITLEAITRTQEDGIIFIDEIDKIAAPADQKGSGPDVSRQGVQRDLLPIVEGSAVNTKHGVVHTDHILFIAAGAFHFATVSDLMPELQGRFPIRVELNALTRDDFERILTEPSNALTKQQQALLKVEGLDVDYLPGAIEAMADLAAEANDKLENIGARRLMTIVERVFEQLNFDAPELKAKGQTKVDITAKFVRQQVEPFIKNNKKGRSWL